MGALFLEFSGDEFVVTKGQTLTFGRSADLVVDSENVHMHRTLGCFVSVGDRWVIQNLGRFISLHIIDRTSSSKAEIGPGNQIQIGFEEFVVRFVAGQKRYEISGALAEFTRIELGLAEPTDTVEFGKVDLNYEQRLMVVCLGEARLRGHDGWVAEMPSNRVVADRLGWSIPKFNRKLDYLCKRLGEQGVAGMLGTADAQASVRRQRLVEVLVESGAVTPADLALLPPQRIVISSQS